MSSIILRIGSLRLATLAPTAEGLARELQNHLDRVVGSRGLGRQAIDQKYGRMLLRGYPADDSSVQIVVEDGSASARAVTAADLPPHEIHESALGYTLARLAHRGLLPFDGLRTDTCLPNGRQLTDLRAIAISLMPRNVIHALTQFHTIGFAGAPPPLGRVRLRIGQSCQVDTTLDDPHALLTEITELQGRCAEKFDLARGGTQRYGTAALRASVSSSDPMVVALDLAAADPADARSTTLQWVLVHLLRPRRPSVYFPVRPWVILPRSIAPAAPLDDGRLLADLRTVRNQLVPPKVALLMQDLHRHGNAALPVSTTERATLQVGTCRLEVRGLAPAALRDRLESAWKPSRAAFEEDPGSVEKYGPVRARAVIEGESVRLLGEFATPGTTDELLLELAIAVLAQRGHLAVEDLRCADDYARGRRLTDLPAVQRQLIPMETVELIEAVHSGTSGRDRSTSGWKAATE